MVSLTPEVLQKLSGTVSSDTVQRKRNFIKKAGIIVALIIVLYGINKLGLAYNTIEVNNQNNSFWEKLSSFIPFGNKKNEPTPTPEETRDDILILGIRGLDDPDAEQGGLLTDTILIFSHDNKTKKSSLISIPRDLYVKVNGKMEKVNAVYERGLAKGDGLEFSKKIFSNITGVHIDKVVVFDFNSFKKIVDALGGIDIYLDKPFSETSQWGYTFYLPAGQNHLDGDKALYYVRSRYSTSDFDRSRRQQQMIMAIKEKVSKLNYIADPIKSIAVLNSIRSGLTTDINIFDIKSLAAMLNQVNSSNISEYIISTENLLYQTFASNMYVLLPKGDNYEEIKLLFKKIIE